MTARALWLQHPIETISAHPVLLAGWVAATAMILAMAMPLTGIMPYGEAEFFDGSDRYDTQQCQKFGFAAQTVAFSNCKIDLREVRRQHQDLIVSSSHH